MLIQRKLLINQGSTPLFAFGDQFTNPSGQGSDVIIGKYIGHIHRINIGPQATHHPAQGSECAFSLDQFPAQLFIASRKLGRGNLQTARPQINMELFMSLNK